MKTMRFQPTGPAIVAELKTMKVGQTIAVRGKSAAVISNMLWPINHFADQKFYVRSVIDLDVVGEEVRITRGQ